MSFFVIKICLPSQSCLQPLFLIVYICHPFCFTSLCSLHFSKSWYNFVYLLYWNLEAINTSHWLQYMVLMRVICLNWCAISRASCKSNEVCFQWQSVTQYCVKVMKCFTWNFDDWIYLWVAVKKSLRCAGNLVLHICFYYVRCSGTFPGRDK